MRRPEASNAVIRTSKIGYIIAELELCWESDAPISKIVNVLARLIDTACGHFAREEASMARDEYSGQERHREAHVELLSVLEALARQISYGEIAVNQELIAALWEWETGHIDRFDREYAEYLKRKVGLSRR